jgi:hypothetical protein
MTYEEESRRNQRGLPERKSRVVACHKCGNENPETFMFCATCGTRISLLCPYCKNTHAVFALTCQKTGEPLPREISAHKKKSKMPLAIAVGTVAIAGTMLLLGPTVQKESTYTYYMNPSHYRYADTIHKPAPSPTPTEVAIRTPEFPNVCCYGVFYPDKCPKPVIIKKEIEKKPQKKVRRNQR